MVGKILLRIFYSSNSFPQIVFHEVKKPRSFAIPHDIFSFSYFDFYFTQDGECKWTDWAVFPSGLYLQRDLICTVKLAQGIN